MDKAQLFKDVASDINRLDKGALMESWLSSAEFLINETLRDDRMIKHSVLPITERNFPAPPNFLEAQGTLSIRLGSDPTAPGEVVTTLKYMPPDQTGDGWGNPDPWHPRGPLWYTVRGREYQLTGWNIDQPYLVDLWYFGVIDKLPNDNSSNWLLDYAPHVYREAMKHFAYINLEEFELSDRSLGNMSGAISVLNNNTEKRKTSGGPLIQRGTRSFGANLRRR